MNDPVFQNIDIFHRFYDELEDGKLFDLHPNWFTVEEATFLWRALHGSTVCVYADMFKGATAPATYRRVRYCFIKLMCLWLTTVGRPSFRGALCFLTEEDFQIFFTYTKECFDLRLTTKRCKKHERRLLDSLARIREVIDSHQHDFFWKLVLSLCATQDVRFRTNPLTFSKDCRCEVKKVRVKKRNRSKGLL